jgi:hypothetical protein
MPADPFMNIHKESKDKEIRGQTNKGVKTNKGQTRNKATRGQRQQATTRGHPLKGTLSKNKFPRPRKN